MITSILRAWLQTGLVLAFLSCCEGESPASETAIVARIDGQPVSKAAVELEFRRAFGQRETTGDEKSAAWRAAREQVIDRQLVLASLEQSKQAASGQDVDFAIAQLEKDLKSQSLTLAQHLQQTGLSADDLRRAVAWKLSWNKYLERYLTDDNLQKYFDAHRREFDGTQLRVAHILLKLPAGADDATAKEALEKAAAIRVEIAAGKLTFAAAAAANSQAPTAKEGGDIGWIERHQPMPEAFSRAAFGLEKGQVSETVRSTAGIHLITVLDIKPGMQTRPQVDAELRPAVTLYLFRRLADKERAKAKIEYAD